LGVTPPSGPKPVRFGDGPWGWVDLPGLISTCVEGEGEPQEYDDALRDHCDGSNVLRTPCH
jgi:hypothetical protein